MLKRYDLPSVNGEGWAHIVIDTEIGMFATVSDYGDYSYLWSNPGTDFRKFLMRIDGDYMCGKLLMGRGDRDVCDEKATKDAIRELINELPDGAEKEDELELLEESDLDSPLAFRDWLSNTNMRESDYNLYSCYRTKMKPQCVAFYEHVMPRFRELLKAELEVEQPDGGERR